MSKACPVTSPPRGGPPTKFQIASAIWIVAFPTLMAFNLTPGGWLQALSPVVRAFVLATIAVPIVVYGLVPLLDKARARLFGPTA